MLVGDDELQVCVDEIDLVVGEYGVWVVFEGLNLQGEFVWFLDVVSVKKGEVVGLVVGGVGVVCC